MDSLITIRFTLDEAESLLQELGRQQQSKTTTELCRVLYRTLTNVKEAYFEPLTDNEVSQLFEDLLDQPTQVTRVDIPPDTNDRWVVTLKNNKGEAVSRRYFVDAEKAFDYAQEEGQANGLDYSVLRRDF